MVMLMCFPTYKRKVFSPKLLHLSLTSFFDYDIRLFKMITCFFFVKAHATDNYILGLSSSH